MSEQVTTSTDCRSSVGVTVGLIDGIIAMARVLKTMDQSSVEVQEALKDLRADEDIAALVGTIPEQMSPEKAYAEWKNLIGKFDKDFHEAFYVLYFGEVIPEGQNPFKDASEKECCMILESMRTQGR